MLTRGKYLLYLVLAYFYSTCFLLNQSDHGKDVCFFPLSISDNKHSRINIINSEYALDVPILQTLPLSNALRHKEVCVCYSWVPVIL